MRPRRPTEAGHHGHSRVRLLTLFATALGSALAFLDTTVVIVALPQMEEDLGLGLTGQQWVYLAYALSLSAFYLVGGAVGDRVGLRRTFVAGVVLFAAASLLTALAPSEGVLIGGGRSRGWGEPSSRPRASPSCG